MFHPAHVYCELYARHLDAAMLSGRVMPQVPAERKLQSTCLSFHRGPVLSKFAMWVDDGMKTLKERYGRVDMGESRVMDEDWALRRHAETLAEIGKGADSEKLTSIGCCVFCLAGPSQHVLECGHSLCDDCVRRFAIARRYRRLSFLIKACMMCGGSSQLEVQLKPATAGIRVLSIDGGGIRGLVPLEFLRNLQRALGSAVRIQDFFDVAFGVSAGRFSSRHGFDPTDRL